MRPYAFAIRNYLISTLKEHQPHFQRYLFFIIFIPLTMLFFLLEWNFQVLVFILLGYSSAFLGFLFASQKGEYSSTFLSKSGFNQLAMEYSDDILLFSKLDDQRILFASPSIELLGHDPQYLKKQSFIFLIHPEDRRALQNQLNPSVIGLSGGFTKRVRIMKRDGEFLWMEITMKMIAKKNGGSNKALIKMRDISKTMELEIATRQLAEELKRKQHESAKTHHSHKSSALAAEEDLREPLSTVKSYVRFFEQKFNPTLSREGQECIHYVKNGLEQMEHMLEKAHSVTSLEKQKIKLENVSVSKLVEQVLEELNEKIVSRNVLVIYDGLPEIVGDRTQLRRLFHNLIDNSIKYNHSERPIIRISCRQEKSNWIFELKDNGIGIKPEFSESIFSLFRQLNAPGAYPGSGTGLTICKTIANHHDGWIWVESEGEGKGCTFFIQIPVGNQITVTAPKAKKKTLRKQKAVRENVLAEV